MAGTAVCIGRDRELAQCLDMLEAGHNLLLRGRDGVGKRTLLRQLYQQVGQSHVCLWLSAGTGKQALFNLALQCHQGLSLQVPERFIPNRYRARVHRQGVVRWSWIQRSLARASVSDLANIILHSVKGHEVTLFVESLELPPTQADFLAELAGVMRLVAPINDSNRRKRIQQLCEKFERQLMLEPLSRQHSRELVEQLIAHQPLRFASDAVRQDFIRAIEQESEGMPAAIHAMIRQAVADGEITPSRLRAYRHEASARYLDMTPIILLSLTAFMAMRYISRGMSDTSLYVLSGVASTLLYAIVLLMRRLRH